MKQKYLSLLAAIGFAFSSCEKVVDIDINDSDPKIVIEANVFNGDDDCLVRISKTGSYFSNEPLQMVSKAKITLSDAITEYSYTEIEEGVYKLNKIGRLIPTLYKIKVNIDGEIYEAKSQMPAAIPINYLVSEYQSGGTIEKTGYQISFGFHDPEDDTNYYRVKYLLNGKLQSAPGDYYLIKDELFNGNSVQMELFGERFEEQDTVTIELMSIDKTSYYYFSVLADLVREESIGSAAPANPPGNFDNGALGYFSAWSSNKRTIIAKQKAQN